MAAKQKSKPKHKRAALSNRLTPGKQMPVTVRDPLSRRVVKRS
jgi:hypothetical protein